MTKTLFYENRLSEYFKKKHDKCFERCFKKY